MERGDDSQSVITKRLLLFSAAEGGDGLGQTRCALPHPSQLLTATGVPGQAGYQMVSQDLAAATGLPGVYT